MGEKTDSLLVGGTSSLAYLLILELLEIITKFPFISKHIVVACIIFAPIAIIIMTIFNSTYGQKRNYNKLFIIINVIGFSLFLIIFCFFL